MKNKFTMSLMIVTVCILFLLSIISLVLAFKPDLLDNIFNSSEKVSKEAASIKLKDYNLYEFDNVSFRFVIANLESNVDDVNLSNFETNEQYNLSNSSNFIATLSTLGFDLSKYNLVTDKLHKGENYVLIPITLKDTSNLLVNSLDGSNQKFAFSLDNPNKDKMALGFKEVEKNVNTTTNTENSTNDKQEDVVFGKLVEVPTNKVLFNNKPYGYPSNVRIFIVPVTRNVEKTNRYVKSAVLKLKSSNININAGIEKVTIDGIKGENMLNNSSSNQGFLLFEINGGTIDLNNLAYDLVYELVVKE